MSSGSFVVSMDMDYVDTFEKCKLLATAGEMELKPAVLLIQNIHRRNYREVVWTHWLLFVKESTWTAGDAAWAIPDRQHAELVARLKYGDRWIWYLKCWSALAKMKMFWDSRTWEKFTICAPQRLLTDLEVEDAIRSCGYVFPVPDYETPTVTELGSTSTTPPPPEVRPGVPAASGQAVHNTTVNDFKAISFSLALLL